MVSKKADRNYALAKTIYFITLINSIIARYKNARNLHNYGANAYKIKLLADHSPIQRNRH